MTEFESTNVPNNMATDNYSDGPMLVNNLSQLANPFNKTINSNVYQNETKLLKFIPPIPDAYSFSDENFQSDSFSVDGFVKRNGKRVHSLEKLKEELTAYMKQLKHSMVDLINEDYTEFINLSTNLISFDKSINNIKTPILKFKEETSHVQSRIEDIIHHLNAKQNRLKTIRDNKLRINMILEISTKLNRVEANMNDNRPRLRCNLFDSETTTGQSNDLYNGNFLILNENATLISRIQTNFNYLLASNDILEKNPNHLLVKLKQRFDKCSQEFYQQLERELCYLLTYDLNKLNSEAKLNEITQLIEKIIRIYLMNDNQKQLENIIRQNIVKPNFDSTIHDSFIGKNGVQGMFERILEFIDTNCALLIKVLISSRTLSQGNPGALSDVGYELLTGTIWKEFVDDCIVRTSSLFSLANVDDFYRNYALTFRFIEDFLHKTSLIAFRDRFESQKNYHQLKAKFNLNVYFLMKLQQIVPNIERSLGEFRFSLCAIPNNQYRLNVTNAMHQCLIKLWHADESKNYVGDLFGYLWKITLKIVSRFGLWFAGVSTERISDWIHATRASTDANAADKKASNETLAVLIFDAQAFIAHFTSLYKAVISPLWINHYRRLQPRIAKQTASSRKMVIEQSSLDASFNTAIGSFHSVAVRHLIQLLKTEIINECTESLNFVNDIPRLYRRTNKEKPSRASAYVGKCCQQLHELITMIGVESNEQWKQQWVAELLHDLTLYYKNATLEVLTSVQKTEDSLKKLKKAKPTANRSQTGPMSDDDKIRVQIYYDVQELGTELQRTLQVNLRSIKPYHELTEMVSSLKILI